MHDIVFFFESACCRASEYACICLDIVHSRSLGEHLTLHVTMMYVRFANA